jgi:hypothetical protein
MIITVLLLDGVPPAAAGSGMRISFGKGRR